MSTPSPIRSSPVPAAMSRRRGLLGPLVGACFLATLAMALLVRLVAPAYLLRLPENYRERAEAALRAGDAAAAIAAVDAELARRPYNFQAAYDLGALLAAAPADAQPRLAASLLTRVGRAYEAFEAVRYRDVFAIGWSEGESLRALSRGFEALGFADQAAAAWHAAAEADPAWTSSRPAPAAPHAPPDLVHGAPAAPPAGACALFRRADFTGPLAAAAGARVLADGSGVGIFQRGRLPLPVPAGEGTAPAWLHVVARAAPAFDGWPYILVEVMGPDGGDRALVGFLRIDHTEWRATAVRLARAPRPGEELHLFYPNDAWDAERGHDRNVWLGEISLLPGAEPPSLAP